jgi:hypothetical protein
MDRDLMVSHLSRLIEFKVDGIVKSTSGLYGLVLKLEQERLIVWIMSDPEGNGPGFLDIEERNG